MSSDLFGQAALSVAVGVILGLLFFGGLWWTVRRALLSPRPALWFLGSMLTRVAITLAGFYWVSADQWWRLLLCTAGFILARPLVTRYLNRTATAADRAGGKPCN